MPRNPYYTGPVSDHFDGTRFHTPGHHVRLLGKRELLAWRMKREKNKAIWPAQAPGTRDQPPERVMGAALRVSYVGHASMLVQTRGLNLLFDPVWSQRASPSRFIGPKRVNAPGIRLADLPPLDAILISHNHYDHMDVATLRQLRAAHPRARIMVPLGNDTILHRHDPALRAEAYDWGASVPLSREIVFMCCPPIIGRRAG